ncbi:MAG: META domain-containing protein [Parabacteroides sp.]
MRKKMYGLCLGMALMGLSGACSSVKTSVKQLDGKWNVTAIAGEKLENVEKLPTMEFDLAALKLHGNAGCNLFNAGLKLDEKDPSRFHVQQAITTLMACPEMDREQRFLQSLDKVQTVKKGADEKQLLLLDAEGQVQLTLQRAE